MGREAKTALRGGCPACLWQVAPGPHLTFWTYSNIVGKLRPAGKGAGPLSPKGEVTKTASREQPLSPSPLPSSPRALSPAGLTLHLYFWSPPSPVCPSSLLQRQPSLSSYKTPNYTLLFGLTASPHTALARTPPRSRHRAKPQTPPLVLCSLQSPRNGEPTDVPSAAVSHTRVGSVYKRAERDKLGCQGPREAAHGLRIRLDCPGSLPRPQAPWEKAVETGPTGRYHLLSCVQTTLGPLTMMQPGVQSD